MKICWRRFWRSRAFALAILAVSGGVSIAIVSPAFAETPSETSSEAPDDPDFELVQVAGPFEHPWSIAFLPDGAILVTERPGRLQLIPAGETSATSIQGLPEILTGGHAGLMDVALDANYAVNGLLYLSYVHGTAEAATVRVLRARLDREALSLAEQQVIFESQPPAPGFEQFGGRLAFDGDGLLYLTLGDRFEGARAQDLGDHAGSIVRIRADGDVPGDNPFVGVDGARPEIWSYGHRNPQGLAFDHSNGRLWSHEHGPRGGDELNVVERGRNYGWPVITYGVGYDGQPIGIGSHADAMEQPLHYWVPSIAPSGLAVYDGGSNEKWRDTLWLGALAGQMVVRLKVVDGRIVREERFLKGQIGRIRDIRMAPDGFLYLVNDEPEGALYRIAPVIEQVSAGPQGGRKAAQ